MIRHLINFLQRLDTSLLNRNIDFDANDSKQYSVVGMTMTAKIDNTKFETLLNFFDTFSSVDEESTA